MIVQCVLCMCFVECCAMLVLCCMLCSMLCWEWSENFRNGWNLSETHPSFNWSVEGSQQVANSIHHLYFVHIYSSTCTIKWLKVHCAVECTVLWKFLSSTNEIFQITAACFCVSHSMKRPVATCRCLAGRAPPWTVSYQPCLHTTRHIRPPQRYWRTSASSGSSGLAEDQGPGQFYFLNWLAL